MWKMNEDKMRAKSALIVKILLKLGFDDWPSALDISQAVDTEPRSLKIPTTRLHLDFFLPHLQDF